MRLAAAIAVALLAIFALSSAIASDRKDEARVAKAGRYVSRGWNVTAAEAPAAARTLVPGDLALRQDLRAARSVALKADVIDPKSGKRVLSKGSALFVIEAQSGTAACALISENDRNSRFAYRWCLKDKDGDRRFEELANYIGPNSGIPVVAGYWPKSPKMISNPVEYGDTDDTSLGRGYFIALRYSGVNIYNRMIFDVIVGNADRVDVVDSLRLEKSEVPTSFSVGGVRAELLSVGKGEIGLRLSKPFEAGPLDVFPVGSAFGGTG